MASSKLSVPRPDALHISQADYDRLGGSTAFVANFIVGRLRACGGSEHPGQLAQAFVHEYGETPKDFLGLGGKQNYLNHLARYGCDKYWTHSSEVVQLHSTHRAAPDAQLPRSDAQKAIAGRLYAHRARRMRLLPASGTGCTSHAAASAAAAAGGSAEQDDSSSDYDDTTSGVAAYGDAMFQPTTTLKAATPRPDALHISQADYDRLGGDRAFVANFIVGRLRACGGSEHPGQLAQAFVHEYGETPKDFLGLGGKQNYLNHLARYGCDKYWTHSSEVVQLHSTHRAAPDAQLPRSDAQKAIAGRLYAHRARRMRLLPASGTGCTSHAAASAAAAAGGLEEQDDSSSDYDDTTSGVAAYGDAMFQPTTTLKAATPRPDALHISQADYDRLGGDRAFVANFIVGRLRACGGSEHPGQLAQAFVHEYGETPKDFLGLGGKQNYLNHLARYGCDKYWTHSSEVVQLHSTRRAPHSNLRYKNIC